MKLLLAALGSDIKPSGKNKWMAKCKVHNDKDFAMSVKLNHDNSIVANCFACGANGLDLYKVLNLDLDELFGKKESGSIPSHIERQLSDDKWFCAVYESDIKKGIRPQYSDQKKYKVSKARIKGIQDKFNII